MGLLHAFSAAFAAGQHVVKDRSQVEFDADTSVSLPLSLRYTINEKLRNVTMIARDSRSTRRPLRPNSSFRYPFHLNLLPLILDDLRPPPSSNPSFHLGQFRRSLVKVISFFFLFLFSSLSSKQIADETDRRRRE